MSIIVTQHDKEILQELAKQYMQIANMSVQAEKMKMWKRFNAHEGTRPMVIIDQHPWNELNADPFLPLRCKEEFMRYFESTLRTIIYRWNNFPVDMVIEPFITVPRAIYGWDFNLHPQKEVLGAEHGTLSQHFTPVLEEEEDVEKIKDMNIREDVELTKARMEAAKEVFDGIAPLMLSHGGGFHLGSWDRLSEYMSVENIYYDIYDRPEFLHACMQRLTDATIAGIKQANELKLHDDIANTCHCSYIYNDKTLADFGQGLGSTSNNCWAFGLAQVFTSVSPAVYEEFELQYINQLAPYFDGIYYGCCERQDDKLDVFLQVKNVKKISCSPWTVKESFAEQVQGKGVVMSVKPSPSFLSGQFDEEVIRKDLRENVELSRKYNVPVEMILKDISTVMNEPQRLNRWAEIAMEEVNR